MASSYERQPLVKQQLDRQTINTELNKIKTHQWRTFVFAGLYSIAGLVYAGLCLSHFPFLTTARSTIFHEKAVLSTSDAVHYYVLSIINAIMFIIPIVYIIDAFRQWAGPTPYTGPQKIVFSPFTAPRKVLTDGTSTTIDGYKQHMATRNATMLQSANSAIGCLSGLALLMSFFTNLGGSDGYANILTRLRYMYLAGVVLCAMLFVTTIWYMLRQHKKENQQLMTEYAPKNPTADGYMPL
eukprot:UN01019